MSCIQQYRLLYAVLQQQAAAKAEHEAQSVRQLAEDQKQLEIHRQLESQQREAELLALQKQQAAEAAVQRTTLLRSVVAARVEQAQMARKNRAIALARVRTSERIEWETQRCYAARYSSQAEPMPIV